MPGKDSRGMSHANARSAPRYNKGATHSIHHANA